MKGNHRTMISHDRHGNADQLKKRRGCRGKSSWEAPSWNLQSGPPRLEHWLNRSCHQPHSLDSRTDSNSVNFRLQCKEMPSFAKPRSRICRHSICESMGFASTCRTKPCWQFPVAANQALATALVSCSASDFSIHGHETPLTLWIVLAGAGFMQCLVPWN